jgi:hypothetical protein
MRNDLAPPFMNRDASATDYIHQYWLSPHVAAARDNIYRTAAASGTALTDRQWESIPDALGRHAFIAQNVAPLLVDRSPHKSIPQALLVDIHQPINQAYFLSFCDEFNCGGMHDLIYLRSTVRFPDRCPSLSYATALRELSLQRELREALDSIGAHSFQDNHLTDSLRAAMPGALHAKTTARTAINTQPRGEAP